MSVTPWLLANGAMTNNIRIRLHIFKILIMVEGTSRQFMQLYSILNVESVIGTIILRIVDKKAVKRIFVVVDLESIIISQWSDRKQL